MEGAFILDFRLYVENDTELVSGVNYGEYQQLYADKLKEYVNNDNLQKNTYANSLYDQVWAFSLAINKSLTSMKSQNLSFDDFAFGKRKNGSTISNILKQELKYVAFHGASGWINFSENQENPTHVNIFQVQKGKPELIGVYNPYSHNVTLTKAAPHINDMPSDRFKIVYQLLPPWLGVCMLVAQGILVGIIITNLLLILTCKNENIIKAISPPLSSLMMIGCYSLSVTLVFLIAHRMLVLSENVVMIKTLCSLKPWMWMGSDLIFAVLFFKLLRVYHVFETFHKTSRYWSDKYLLFYVLAVCGFKAILVIFWNSTGSIHLENQRMYVNEPDQVPYYVASVRCTTSGVWLAAGGLYSGVLLFLVVILAVATRHIKKESFKDTKKVNTFIFWL